jgi:hypothetical protein
MFFFAPSFLATVYRSTMSPSGVPSYVQRGSGSFTSGFGSLSAWVIVR